MGCQRCRRLCAVAAPLALAALAILLLPSASGVVKPEETLIGWKGETYHPNDERAIDPSLKDKVAAPQDTRRDGRDPGKPWVQVLSWKPRAFVYHNFLSKAELKHILELAAPQMKRSQVEGPNHTGLVDNVRTSAGTFLRRHQTKVITAVEERMSLWTQLPISHQEDIQVLRYGPTNKYGEHMDGLGRVLSVLIYLVPPEEGGETAFPLADEWLHPEVGEPTQGLFSACAKSHIAYKPKAGDALMFYDLKPDYVHEDSASTHTGCPVIRGVKWNAVMWIHGVPFQPDNYEKEVSGYNFEEFLDPGLCMDYNDECTRWAEAGECENNPAYMIGKPEGNGRCRKACRDCEVCAEADEECYYRNRATGGYVNFDLHELEGYV